MLHVACTVYCNQYVSMAPQRWHEALHHYQSSSPSWYLSVEKTVRCIVSRLCGWNHQPQAKDSAWKPKPSTSSTASSPATSTSLLLTWIVAKVQKFYFKLFAAAQEFSSTQCPCSCMLAWLTRISSLVCTIWLQHHISWLSLLFLLYLNTIMTTIFFFPNCSCSCPYLCLTIGNNSLGLYISYFCPLTLYHLSFDQ